MAGLLDLLGLGGYGGGMTPGYNPNAPSPGLLSTGVAGQGGMGGGGWQDKLQTGLDNPLTQLGIGLLSQGDLGRGLAAGAQGIQQTGDRKQRRALLGLQTQATQASLDEKQRVRGQAAQYRATLPPDSPLAALPDEQLLAAAGTLATREPRAPMNVNGKILDPKDPTRVLADYSETPEQLAAKERAKFDATLPGRLKVAEAGKANTTVNVDTTNKPFYNTLGEGAAKGLLAGRDTAQAAARQVDSVRQARDLVDQGIITGPGADLQLGIARVGTLFGFGKDQVANTEAFTSSVGRQTLDLVKQLGAGSGISNADREYAEKVAGGSIKFTEEGLKRILDINERASTELVSKHNKSIEPYLKDPNIPQSIRDSLRVEPPGPRAQKPGVPAGAKPVGTYQGKRVFEINGKRFVED